MNVINFNHDFININTPKCVTTNYGSVDKCVICSKCKLVVGTFEQFYDIFYMNGIELFIWNTNLKELNLTCEELQIKMLLE